MSLWKRRNKMFWFHQPVLDWVSRVQLVSDQCYAVPYAGRWYWDISALHIWLGPNAIVHFAVAALVVGRRTGTLVLVGTWNTLLDDRLRLVLVWVRLLSACFSSKVQNCCIVGNKCNDSTTVCQLSNFASRFKIWLVSIHIADVAVWTIMCYLCVCIRRWKCKIFRVSNASLGGAKKYVVLIN